MQFKRLLRYAGKYKIYLLLCPLVMIGEVMMETLIPLLTATLIDDVIPGCQETGSIQRVLLYGGLMVLMSLISMAFGMTGSRLSALGGMGFSKNLRRAVFEKIQHFSLSSILLFSINSHCLSAAKIII